MLISEMLLLIEVESRPDRVMGKYLIISKPQLNVELLSEVIRCAG